MKKHLLIFLILTSLLFLSAWNWKTHQAIVEGSKEGEIWEKWILTKDSSFSEKAAQKSYYLSLNTALDIFNINCNHKKTRIIKNDLSYIGAPEIIITACILYLIISLILSILKNPIK